MASDGTVSPTPEARDGPSKRKRSISPIVDPAPPPTSRPRLSPPPAEATRLTMDIPRIQDSDPVRRREREEQMRLRLAEQEAQGVVEKPKIDMKTEMQKMALTRGGGAYIPPARLRAMQAEMKLDDPNSQEYQRVRWDALRKSINGLINKVNVGNIKNIIPELFGENLVRGRGLFCRSIMRAQASSLPFTPIFAALVCVINTKLPIIGDLLVQRLISQFRRAYKRNDKPTCIATSTFIAHLVNQQVVAPRVALEIIILLIEKVTDDSVEIAVGFVKEVGAFLAQEEPRHNMAIYQRFNEVLQGSEIQKRSQYMIEVLAEVRRDKFKDNPIIPEGLDLVEDDDVIVHPTKLQDDVKVEEGLNIFKYDPEFVENEAKYEKIKREILGDDSDDEEGSGSGSEEESSDEDEPETGIVDGKVAIHDQTGANLINFRRSIYLTIMSSLDFEEASHKLLKMNIEEGMELELANMVVECCSQERTYTKFYGLLGERFCKINLVWAQTFEQCFRNYYDTIHRYETNRLRNIARFFGHLLAQDGIPWTVFEVVKMNEDDTTSSSRIFVKILFQELSESLGLKVLAERFKDPTMRGWFGGMFPVDNPKNTRFSINYFTSIGLGVLTEDMREHLKSAPALMAAARKQIEEEQSSSDSDSSSDVSSSSDDSSSEASDSDSEDDRRPRRRRSYSEDSRDDRRRRRPRSISRSPTPPRRSRYDDQRDRDRRRSPSVSRSRSPPPPRRRRDDSADSYDSRSPPRRRRDDDSPPRRRRDSPPPRDRRRADSPPPPARNGRSNGRSYDDSPPRRRRSPSPEGAGPSRKMMGMNPARAAMIAGGRR